MKHFQCPHPVQLLWTLGHPLQTFQSQPVYPLPAAQNNTNQQISMNQRTTHPCTWWIRQRHVAGILVCIVKHNLSYEGLSFSDSRFHAVGNTHSHAGASTGWFNLAFKFYPSPNYICRKLTTRLSDVSFAKKEKLCHRRLLSYLPPPDQSQYLYCCLETTQTKLSCPSHLPENKQEWKIIITRSLDWFHMIENCIWESQRSSRVHWLCSIGQQRPGTLTDAKSWQSNILQGGNGQRRKQIPEQGNLGGWQNPVLPAPQLHYTVQAKHDTLKRIPTIWATW